MVHILHFALGGLANWYKSLMAQEQYKFILHSHKGQSSSRGRGWGALLHMIFEGPADGGFDILKILLPRFPWIRNRVEAEEVSADQWKRCKKW